MDGYAKVWIVSYVGNLDGSLLLALVMAGTFAGLCGIRSGLKRDTVLVQKNSFLDTIEKISEACDLDPIEKILINM